jgi:hypothetical protein
MPRELRKIYFNAVDLTHAIETFRNEKPQFLPLGKLFHVAVEPEHLLVRIEMKYVDNTHHLDYKIDYDKLVEVLIALCIERRIPLPSAGQKTTYAEDDEVILEIVLADDAVAAGNKSTEWARLRGVGAG